MISVGKLELDRMHGIEMHLAIGIVSLRKAAKKTQNKGNLCKYRVFTNEWCSFKS